MLQHLFKFLIAFVVLLYPIAVYFGLQHLQPKTIAIILAALVLLRGFIARSKLIETMKGLWLIVLVVGILVAGLSFILNSALGLKLYPVIITGSFLAVFGYSLYAPPTIIERFARLQTSELPPEAIPYTTKVTKIWCLFFIINILVSLYTVFFTSVEIWALYNGLISYLLMGLLFIGEWGYRRLVLKQA